MQIEGRLRRRQTMKWDLCSRTWQEDLEAKNEAWRLNLWIEELRSWAKQAENIMLPKVACSSHKPSQINWRTSSSVGFLCPCPIHSWSYGRKRCSSLGDVASDWDTERRKGTGLKEQQEKGQVCEIYALTGIIFWERLGQVKDRSYKKLKKKKHWINRKRSVQAVAVGDWKKAGI